jgi:hypothetical protein
VLARASFKSPSGFPAIAWNGEALPFHRAALSENKNEYDTNSVTARDASAGRRE